MLSLGSHQVPLYRLELVLQEGSASVYVLHSIQFLVREGGLGVLCIVGPSEGLVRLAVKVNLHVQGYLAHKNRHPP
jgi:hypothetical protein